MKKTYLGLMTFLIFIITGCDIELTSQASGTVRHLPELNISENAPVARDIQSTYFKTTDLNREFRRGIFEFSVPEFLGEILEANLILEESRAIISSPVPPDTHILSYYTADLEVTSDDYNRSTTYFESFETDANDSQGEFIFDVTSLINEFEEANLGFRVELSIDTTFDEIKNFGSGFKANPKIEVIIKNIRVRP